MGTITCLLPRETDTDRAMEISTAGVGFVGSVRFMSLSSFPGDMRLGEVGDGLLLAGERASLFG